MGPYRDFSIYLFDFFDSYWITLLVYILGVAVVLALGFQFNYILQLVMYKEEAKKEKSETDVLELEQIEENSELENNQVVE